MKNRTKKLLRWQLFLYLVIGFIPTLVPESKATVNQQIVYLPVVLKNYMGKDHYYAQGYKIGIFTGIRASITTADPVIRENGFSYASINISDSNGLWVEMGWTKAPFTDCIPKFSFATQPGTPVLLAGAYPVVGRTYQYQIAKVSDGYWNISYKDLNGSLIYETTLHNPGMDSATLVQAVGEVESLNAINDMGVSNMVDLKFRNTSNIWYSWNGWASLKDIPYHIVGITSDPSNNLQVYGNNGNPVPPNAPCP